MCIAKKLGLPEALTSCKSESISDTCENCEFATINVLKQRDDLMRELVSLAKEEDKNAGLLVLKVLTHYLKNVSSKDMNHDFYEYLSVAWERIILYSLNPDNKSTIVNIVLDSLKVLSRQHEREVREKQLLMLNAREQSHIGNDDNEVSERAIRVIEIAKQYALISKRDIQILTSVYIDCISQKEAALLYGMSLDTVRYHCSNALRVLSKHKQFLLGEL
jgi:DNA-binding CsgD family transcriptional regulator